MADDLPLLQRNPCLLTTKCAAPSPVCIVRGNGEAKTGVPSVGTSKSRATRGREPIVAHTEQAANHPGGSPLALEARHETHRRGHHEPEPPLPGRWFAHRAGAGPDPKVRGHSRPRPRRGGRPVGVVSLRDLLRDDPPHHATSPAFSIVATTTVEAAARALAETDYHHLVVVDEKSGRAVGMISSVDLLRALLDMAPRHPGAFQRSEVVRNRPTQRKREAPRAADE